MDSSTSTIMGIGGAAAVIYSVRTIINVLKNANSGENPPIQPVDTMDILNNQMMTYEVVSRLWRDHEAQTRMFTDLAQIWCDPPSKQDIVARVVNFTHPEIATFWQNKIKGKPYFTAPVEIAVLDILELLDKYGDCPSVVDKNDDEPERMYQGQNNTYTELERIPLYLHSLHAAEEAIKRTEGAHVTKLVIAMLTHDLGKIPAYYGRYYQSSTHPFCSVTVIETLESVTSLRYCPDILAAVRNHHLQSDVPFDVAVKECDQAARRREINGLISTATGAVPYTAPQIAKSAPRKSAAPKPLPGQLELLPAAPTAEHELQSKSEAEVVPVQTPSPIPIPMPIASMDNAAGPPVPLPISKVEALQRETPPGVQLEPVPEPPSVQHNVQAAAEIPPPVEVGQRDQPTLKTASLVGDDQQERTRAKRQLVDISAWFEPERFITELAGVVNTRIDGLERFWSALEKDGYVYFKPRCFWMVIERHSKRNSDVLAAAAFEQKRDDTMYSAVRQLSKMDDVVATEFIDPDQIGAIFLHNPKDATEERPAVKLYLIPLRSSAFAQYSDAFSKRLTASILRTKELAPLYPIKAKARKHRGPESQA